MAVNFKERGEKQQSKEADPLLKATESHIKTAIVHEWLVNYAGSERVLEQIIRLYPDADIFSVCDFLPPDKRDFILNKKVKTTFIQGLPSAKTKYRSYLPLMPIAMRQLDLSGYDLIITNSHSVAKGIRKYPGQLHICYCHTPMRYAWDLRDQYLKDAGLDNGIKGFFVRGVLNRIRRWDVSTSRNIDHFICNSNYIRERIKRAYGRDAALIYPPVDIGKFQLNEKREGFFLTVSRMVPYKKLDLIVDAFSETGLPLKVIGDGPDLEKIKERAGRSVEFLGFRDDNVLKRYMQRARAFIFAAEEDFGIVPVEAQACGTPVIAFGKGGVTETVIPAPCSEGGEPGVQWGCLPAPTGIFFHEQTVSALVQALKEFETIEDKFDPSEIRGNAMRFGIERFRREFSAFVDEKVKKFFERAIR